MKPTICLAMIVRDEVEVIERCIDAAEPLFDSWLIVDTGSKDGTPNRIRDLLQHRSGELHEREWIDFGHNRSELLELARGKADYLLLLDADMTVEMVGEWPTKLPDEALIRIPSEEFDYRLPLLVRSDLNWRYEGVTHEYLTTNDEHTRANVDHLIVRHHLDGGTRGEKFERDLELLRASDLDDPRNVFYLAQTHRDLGDRAHATALYLDRAKMGGFAEEVYYSLLQVGIGRDLVDDLLAAWELRPERLEALYEAVSRLRLRGHHHAAHALVKDHTNSEPPDDILFVSPWVYRYGLLFEYSIAAYWIGDHEGSLEACDRLLAMDDFPEPYREQTERNRDFALGAVGAAA